MCGRACLCPKHKFYKPVLAVQILRIIYSVAGGWHVEGKRRQPLGLWMKHLDWMLVSFTEMETVREGVFQTFREKKMNERKISDLVT